MKSAHLTAFVVLAAGALAAGTLVACAHDFDIYEGAAASTSDAAPIEGGADGGTTSPPAPGSDASTPPADASSGGPSDAASNGPCAVEAACKTTFTSCTATCDQKYTTCVTACGNNNNNNNNNCTTTCRDDRDTCKQACGSTCRMCTGMACRQLCF